MREEEKKAKSKLIKWAPLPVAIALMVLAIHLYTRPRYVEFEEEVMLGDPPRVEVIKRRIVKVLTNYQFDIRHRFARSELYLYGKREPVWSDALWPLYLEKLPNDEGYLLVAGIESGLECYRRGRPTSYYVTIKITPTETVEIPTPARLEGKSSNLLFRWGNIPDGRKHISLVEKEHLNNLYYKLYPRQKNLLLSSKFGC